jgi:hypothetical protein
VTHIWQKGVATSVPANLIGGKVLLVDGYVGVTITKLRDQNLPEKVCKQFLAEFALAGPSFDPSRDSYPARLTVGARVKLV